MMHKKSIGSKLVYMSFFNSFKYKTMYYAAQEYFNYKL